MSHNYRLREAEVSDLPFLIQHFIHFFREEGILPEESAIAANLVTMLEDDRACIFLMEQNGQLCGFGTVTLSHGVEYGWTAEIEDLYLLPEWRGQGLSKKLIEAGESWAARLGAQSVFVVVTAQGRAQQGLETFYRKQGYEEEGRRMLHKALKSQPINGAPHSARKKED